MFAKKKLSENVDPHPRSRRLGPNNNNKKGATEVLGKGMQPNVRKPAIGQTRAAFGDITNANKDLVIETDKKKIQGTQKSHTTRDITAVPGNKNGKPLAKKKTVFRKEPEPWSSLSQNSSTCSSVSSSSSLTDQVSSQESSFSDKEQAQKNLVAGVPIDRVEEDISIAVIDGSDDEVSMTAGEQESSENKETSLLSIDQENYADVFNVGIYAQNIFDYYKRREKMFSIPAYIEKQCRITTLMRAILVDWMVEIQENFELNHETLYLAVKLTDMYLSKVPADKEVLQLIGAASVFIASKFDERCPPLIEDFIYICDNAFNREQFIAMEMEVLRVVDFNLGIPISYSFLRRYAKVARMSMETLTLARYILEISLMEYSLVVVRDSLLAAAALYIAQKMRKEGAWEGDIVKSSGYVVEDIRDLVVTLNTMLHAPPVPQLSTIRCKYSHEVFYKVAKISPLSTKNLL